MDTGTRCKASHAVSHISRKLHLASASTHGWGWLSPDPAGLPDRYRAALAGRNLVPVPEGTGTQHQPDNCVNYIPAKQLRERSAFILPILSPSIVVAGSWGRGLGATPPVICFQLCHSLLPRLGQIISCTCSADFTWSSHFLALLKMQLPHQASKN